MACSTSVIVYKIEWIKIFLFIFQENLVATLNNIVKKCPRSLIIFDEIHDMCPSVLDTIKPMLDHHHAVDGVDYRLVYR